MTYSDAIAVYQDGEIQWREAKAGAEEEGSLRDQRQRAIQERITRDLQYQYAWESVTTRSLRGRSFRGAIRLPMVV